MIVSFAGVGEAFDETLPNTSVLVESGSSSILLDCGFSASCGFWGLAKNPLDLDAVYISHFHGDHYFGLPSLIVRSVEEGRRKRLTILGPSGIESRVNRLLELAYSNVRTKAKFELFFIECDPDEDIKHSGFRFRFAMSSHSMPSLGVRLDAGGKSLFYSGDGAPTFATAELARGCDMLIMESYILDADAPGHGSVDSSLELARQTGAGICALVHVQRIVRRTQKGRIMAKLNGVDGFKAVLPESGDSFDL
ncbi:MBL fold metallo-hydrolase [Pseudodesulfovibrio sediminis]|uniref:MBL fold metallo-hydrolase n=1 Tax=Pseudodesulfovibrio sediminis TaxID=2810563 RepID=A0ABN6EV29_9BACT|nr:ribonuclease Z [Pseudodesulfovibrio sediminis]BCS89327.1 MBL fold metallo-hydrolase [Pseudodesulfovibrio sediminis]